MSEVDAKIMEEKRWEFFQDYEHDSLSFLFEGAYRIGYDEGFKKLQVENDRLRKGIEFLLTFAPKTKAIKGLDPTFYFTLTYEGDCEIDRKLEELKEGGI